MQGTLQTGFGRLAGEGAASGIRLPHHAPVEAAQSTYTPQDHRLRRPQGHAHGRWWRVAAAIALAGASLWYGAGLSLALPLAFAIGAARQMRPAGRQRSFAPLAG